MRRKTIIILISAAVIVLGFNIYSSFRDKNELKRDTVSYLEAKGYVYETDIEQISIVNFSLNEDIYAAVVTFRDEPMADYLYAYKRNSKEIYQVDGYNRGTNLKLKHKEN